MAYRHYANPKKKRDWTQQFGNIAGGLGNLAQIIHGFQQLQAQKQAQALEQQKFNTGIENQNRMRQSFKEPDIPPTAPLNASLQANLPDLVMQSKQQIPQGTGPINPRMDVNAPWLGAINGAIKGAQLQQQPLPDVLSNVKVNAPGQRPIQTQLKTDPALANPSLAYRPGSTRNIPGWTDAEIESVSQNSATLAQLLQAKKEGKDLTKLAENEVMVGPTGVEIARGLPKATTPQNQTRENYYVEQVKAGKMTEEQMNERLAKEADSSEYVYQDENKRYRVGLFDNKKGNMVKDLRAATAKDIELKPTAEISFYEEKAESKKVGEFHGDEYAAIQKAGREAQKRANQIDSIMVNLEGVTTGKLTPAAAQLAAWAQAFGIDIDPNLGAKQAAESLKSQLALQLRNPASGAGLPGNLSDQDREYLSKLPPGLEKTPEGNKIIADTMKKIGKRDVEIAKMAREYRKKHDRIDEGFFDEVDEFINNNPLFPQALPKTKLGEFRDFVVEKGYNRQQALDWIDSNKERLKDEGLEPNTLKEYIGKSLE